MHSTREATHDNPGLISQLLMIFAPTLFFTLPLVFLTFEREFYVKATSAMTSLFRFKGKITSLPIKGVFLSKPALSFLFTRLYTQYAQNDQIFLHETDHKTAVSFSKLPSSIPIGYTTSNTVTPELFQANSQFLPLLHSTLASCVNEDFSFIVEAGVNANTFMPIYDFREVPKFGRRPDIDSVFGYVQVDGLGKIIPGSYESNEMYRLCNASGLPRLTDYMYEQIQEKIEN